MSEILSMFCEENGPVYIIIASSAFGMGVDCSNIREIIHWGPPTTLESYIQETRRAGCDGCPAIGTRLLYGHASKYVTKDMKLYGLNSTICHKQFLYNNSTTEDTDKGSLCSCCDICSSRCECESCITPIFFLFVDLI